MASFVSKCTGMESLLKASRTTTSNFLELPNRRFSFERHRASPNTMFHTKEIPSAKRYASVRVSVNQSHAVRVPLEHKANDDCVMQHSKSQMLIKPRLLLEENDDQKHTADQQAKLKFPELLKNMRRNQHHKSSTKAHLLVCVSPTHHGRPCKRRRARQKKS